MVYYIIAEIFDIESGKIKLFNARIETALEFVINRSIAILTELKPLLRIMVVGEKEFKSFYSNFGSETLEVKTEHLVTTLIGGGYCKIDRHQFTFFFYAYGQMYYKNEMAYIAVRKKDYIYDYLIFDNESELSICYNSFAKELSEDNMDSWEIVISKINKIYLDLKIDMKGNTISKDMFEHLKNTCKKYGETKYSIISKVTHSF